MHTGVEMIIVRKNPTAILQRKTNISKLNEEDLKEHQEKVLAVLERFDGSEDAKNLRIWKRSAFLWDFPI